MAHSSRVPPPRQQELEVAHCAHCQEAKNNEPLWCSAGFVLVIQSRTNVRGMVLPRDKASFFRRLHLLGVFVGEGNIMGIMMAIKPSIY